MDREISRAGRGRGDGDPATLTLSAMFFVQLAETAAEAERLRAVIAARYGLAPHDAADHPLFLWSARWGSCASGSRSASPVSTWATWCSSCGTTEVLARVGAEVLSGLR